MNHDAAHEELLQSVLTGQRAESDGEVQDRLAACAHCRSELAGLGELAERLDVAGEADRADLAEALALLPDDGGQARGLLERGRPLARGARASRLGWMLGAAAAIVVAVWLATGSDPRDVILGPPPGIGKLTPSGEVEEFGTFRWELPLPVEGAFQVRVYDAGDQRRESARVRSQLLRVPEWTPGAAELARFPADGDILWEVVVFDIDNNMEDGDWTRCRLR